MNIKTKILSLAGLLLKCCLYEGDAHNETQFLECEISKLQITLIDVLSQRTINFVVTHVSDCIVYFLNIIA